jgi:magnesium transporter
MHIFMVHLGNENPLPKCTNHFRQPTMKPLRTTKKYEAFEWIDVTHPDAALLSKIAKEHQLDPILLYDSVEHGHLPKIEKLPNYSFVILRAYSANKHEVVTNVGELSNKVAFFIKGNLLITIHRARFDFLETLQANYSHLHDLLLDILNAMVTSYNDPLTLQTEKMDAMEKTIFLKDGETISIRDLYYQKSKARISRKLLIMTQAVIGQLEIDPIFQTKLQDIKDTLTHAILLYEEVNEDANNLTNTYLSISAQKNNDVMKLLTVFSAFFLPITFIAGVYGMNFDYMPELRSPLGYFVTLGAMALVGAVIYVWFRRKRIL